MPVRSTSPSSDLAIVNALAPLCDALIARPWIKERLSFWRSLDLVIGFSGILALAYHSLFFSASAQRLAIPASITATIRHGVAVNYVRC